MKRNRIDAAAVLALLLCMLFLTACGASAAEQDGETPETPTQEAVSAPEAGQTAEQGDATLEDLLGEDYVNYVTETITMQMGNRMEKTPEVRYYPIEDNAPLSDYVTIDENTEFGLDEEGNPVIFFPAGTVTDEAHGEQSFRIPKLYQ